MNGTDAMGGGEPEHFRLQHSAGPVESYGAPQGDEHSAPRSEPAGPAPVSAPPPPPPEPRPTVVWSSSVSSPGAFPHSERDE
jgi:hypothetical protein